MAKVKMAGPDTRSINIEDDYAVEFWTKEFNVSQGKLRKAVQEVGTIAIDVKRQLKK